MMTATVFPFPGGKSRFASWILEHIPNHDCFVELFGGAAGVLVNKNPDQSTVEVYNDKDGDLVHFFETLREAPGELQEWLELVPYSRRVHELWAERYYHGYRPADPIARAGQFFFLRYSQWGGIFSKQAGFGTSKTRSRAQSFTNKIERFHSFASRFDDVVIEQLDWPTAVEKYDSKRTVFYADPPYVDQEEYYPESSIAHRELIEMIGSSEGDWVVSYEELPPGAEEYNVVERETTRMVNSGKRGYGKPAAERLIVAVGD